MTAGKGELVTGAPGPPGAPVTGPAAATTPAVRQGRGAGPGRRARALPYLLIVPSLLAFGLLLGYPVYQVFKISFLRLNLAELVQRRTVPVGFENYRTVLSDPFVWSVALRTVLFTLACVGLTMLLATLVALLLDRLGKGLRLALSVALVLAWAMPPVTATVVWQWLFDTQFGVVNWLLTAIGAGDYSNHGWFDTGLSTFAIITAIIVWQAIPFVAFTLYAGLTAIPRELYDAIRVDGASAWNTFRSLIFPLLRPLFMITAFLSIIWDFKVFTQVWLIRQGGPARQTVTLPLYIYIEGLSQSRFGTAAAISVLMVVVLLAGMIFYVRRMVREQEGL